MLTEDQLSELEAKYKTIAVVRNSRTSEEIVLRKPTRTEYKLFRANANNPQKHEMAQEILVRQIAVYPDAASVEALFESWLGVDQACSKALRELLGLTADESLKG